MSSTVGAGTHGSGDPQIYDRRGTTLASLVAKTLVGKVINEPISQGCSDLIEKERKLKWLASRATVYHIPMCYAPLADWEVKEAQGVIDCTLESPDLRQYHSYWSGIEFNLPVPDDHDFTTELEDVEGIITMNYRDIQNICARMIDLLECHGIKLKRGDVICNYAYYLERLPEMFIVNMDGECPFLISCGESQVSYGFNAITEFPPRYFSSLPALTNCNIDIDMFAQEILDNNEPIQTTKDDCEVVQSEIVYNGITYTIFIWSFENKVPLNLEELKKYLKGAHDVSFKPTGDSEDLILPLITEENKNTTIIFEIQ